MRAFGRWFRRHWFGGVFVILLGVWTITTVAYLTGARSITFGNRYGRRPTIDFMRQHDRPVVALRDGVGLELDDGGPALRGVVIGLGAAPSVLCWLCGDWRPVGGLAMVDYRRGDWFYRAPVDRSNDREAREGRPESRAFINTIAYNRATGERVVVEASAGVAAQERALSNRGLPADDVSRLSLESLGDLGTVSMMREGCVIVQAAFLAAAALWLVLGGLAVLLVHLVRRARRG